MLDVALPMLRIPIRPGRNIASIIEVAARNPAAQAAGTTLARDDFQDRITRAWTGRARKPARRAGARPRRAVVLSPTDGVRVEPQR